MKRYLVVLSLAAAAVLVGAGTRVYAHHSFAEAGADGGDRRSQKVAELSQGRHTPLTGSALSSVLVGGGCTPPNKRWGTPQRDMAPMDGARAAGPRTQRSLSR